MSQDAILAKRYAKGLAEEAQAVGEMAEVRQDLETVAALLDDRHGDAPGRELLGFLSAPAVRVEDKVRAATNILEAVGVGPTVTRFFSLLIRHRRTGVLPLIIEEFSTVASELTGECTALVETARPLTEEQQGRLESVLASALGGIVRVRQRVVPGLLAGARIRIGDRTIDGSVLGRLETLRSRLVYGPLEGDKPELPECAAPQTGGQR